MKLFHWFATAVIVGALSLWLVNCSNNPSCNATNCAKGCCTTNGLCDNGNTGNACGSGGKACTVCTGSQVCTSGVCQNACTSNCGGQDSGNPDSGNQDAGGGNNGQFAGYCNQTGVTCNGGLQCLGLGGNGGVCTAICGDGGTCAQGSCVNLGNLSACGQTCTGATCGPDDICASFSANVSICIPSCGLHPDLCPSGTVCTNGLCLQPGTQMFGQPCGPGIGACDSAAGLECVLLITGNPAFCTAGCTTTPDSCMTKSPAGTCDLLGPDGGFACGFPCASADGGMGGGCPTGLTCQAAFGTFFCQ